MSHPSAPAAATADPPGLQLAGLAAWMGQHIEDYDGSSPPTAELMAGGRSNVTYLLRQQDRLWVLRRPPLGHVMASAHDMGREHRVLSGLDRVGFPAPAPLGLCEDLAVIGAPFMLMDYVDGRVVADADDAGLLAPAETDQICQSFISTLAQLHQLDVQAAGLSSLGRPEGYLTRQLRRWTGQWQTTKTRDLSGFETLADWVGEHLVSVPAGLPWSVVHGDYRLDNLILAPTGPEIRAVLDWEMSTLGDPVSDLAIVLVYWSRPADELRHRLPVAHGVTDGPGFWERNRLVEAYAAHTGFDLGHLDVCVALACLKLAVIMESIHYRNLSGQQIGAAADDAAGAMGRATEALVQLGLAVRDGGVDALSR
jgi:aminoglycoside phosphotransferase (APT) family kinase protein